jgi:hypothetical protein
MNRIAAIVLEEFFISAPLLIIAEKDASFAPSIRDAE